MTKPRQRVQGPEVGQTFDVVVGSVAHGGHAVARLDGRVVFVRHALPGENVRIRVTEGGSKFWRADAIEVLDNASPDRVKSAWPEAGPGGVGGGELAHVSLAGQRVWKRAVIVEQFQRLAKVDVQAVAPGFDVEALDGDEARRGLRYRTRIDLVAGPDGRAGMSKFRSHDIVPLTAMPLATEAVEDLAASEDVFTRKWRPGQRITLAAPANGSEPMMVVSAGVAHGHAPEQGEDWGEAGIPWRSGKPDSRPNARRTVTETVTAHGRTHEYRVAGDGFWQIHRGAPGILTSAVLDVVPENAGTILDLYSGAGLFTAFLADTGATVHAVEGDARAVRDARRNLHDARDRVELLQGHVEEVLASPEAPQAADVVVLDPPRVGAGRGTVDQVAARNPGTVIYVACDPAALARDVHYFATHGYGLTSLRAFDIFPMTHHVEAVAMLTRR